MSAAPGPLLPLVGAAAGGLAALAAREAVLATPAVAQWLRLALLPLRRAGEEGYAPSTLERRRLAAVGAGAALLAGWFFAGPTVAMPLAVAGPGLAGWAVSSRRRRYTRALERALPEVATAIADSLAAGRSLRASLPAAAIVGRRAGGGRAGPSGGGAGAGSADGDGDRGMATADALGQGRRLRRRPAQPAACRRRPRRAPAPLRRRRRRARSRRRGRALGDRAGALHRPARRRDAERRRPLRRADPARDSWPRCWPLRRRRSCLRWPRRCSSPASSRSGALPGWSSEVARIAGAEARSVPPRARSRRSPPPPRRRGGSRCWSRSACRSPASSCPTRCWSARRAAAIAA